MTLAINNSIRNSRLSEISAAADAGSSGALLGIYNGTRPSKGGAVTTLLSQLAMGETAFEAPSSGSMQANPVIGDSSADAQGTATWFRLTDSSGVFILDGDVGVTGSGADMIISNDEIEVGFVVDIISFTITDGNA